MSAFVWPARVYWEDTDGGGVVYYANYLKFFERARTEWLRARGHAQAQLALDPGVLFSVVEVNVRYRRPARLDDLLLISCAPKLDGVATISFEQQIHRGAVGGELLAEASVRVACVRAADFRPRRLPQAIVRDCQQ
jgi:acyl-CoA thioester hydrolase